MLTWLTLRLVFLHSSIPLSLLAAAFVCSAGDIPSSAGWTQHLAAANAAMRAGDYANAAPLYETALHEARTLGNTSAAVAHVLDDLGPFYGETGDFTRAESVLKEALKIWRLRLGPDDPALSRPVSRLADTYIEAGQLDKAERLELGKWVDRVRSLPRNAQEIVPLLQDIGLIESRRGRLAKARPLFEEAIEKIRDGALSGTEYHALTLNNFGLACLHGRKYAEAIDHFTASAALWEHICGSDCLSRGVAEFNLGAAYEGAGRLPEAETHIQTAIRIAEARIGPDNLRTGVMLQAYARLLRKNHRKEESRAMASRAARIMNERRPQARPPYTVDVGDLYPGRR